MRYVLISALVAALALSQNKNVDAALTAWKAEEAIINKLQKESDQLAAEWQNRQVGVRDAKLRQKEHELVLQSELCEKNQRVKMVDGKPICEAPPKEKKE